MMVIWTRETALKILLNINGKFIAGTCRDDDSWYSKHHLEDLRKFIFEWTSFLNDVTFHERMLYFKLNITQQLICIYCNNSLIPNFGTNSFSKTCKSNVCRKKAHHDLLVEMHNNFTDEQKMQRAQRIGNSNRISYEERYGIEDANALKQKLSIQRCALGITQSEETKVKRINTRKKNNETLNREWHTQDTKEKISLSNQITHSSTKFREEHAQTYAEGYLKQSATMKNKIENKEFTPNSNNWRRSIRFQIDNIDLTFRSSWEATFYLTHKLLTSELLEYETARIRYTFNGSENIYIPDFISQKQRILYEIRPKSRQTSEKELAKFEAAKIWAIENELQFVLIDEDWFQQHKEFVLSAIDKYDILLRKMYNVIR